VVHGGVVYVAGQLPLDPGSASREVGSIEDQTRQVLANIRAILEAAGSGLDRVLQMTVYITDIELWGRFNATYVEVMGDHKPARAVVPVNGLHYGYHVEVQAIAAVR
jgi:2-iminobutanoate/2-iminopropanoate deaminase